MIMTSRRFAAFFLLVFSIVVIKVVSVGTETEVSVSARLEKSAVHVGETVKFHVVAQWDHDEELQVNSPSPPELSGFELIGTAAGAKTVREGKKTVYGKTFTYILDPKKAGEALIGSVVLEYGKNKKSTSTRQIRVKIQPAPIDYISYIKKGLPWVLGLVVLMAGGRMVIGSIRKKKATAEPKISVEKTIEETALEQIKTGETITDSGEYFSLISATLREYLKKKFQLTIATGTTSSILTELKTHGLSPEYLNRVEHIFIACDAVKFAGHQPDKEKTRQIQDDFINLIKKEGTTHA
jgi:hypothetical protein